MTSVNEQVQQEPSPEKRLTSDPSALVRKGLKRRYRAERRFKWFGMLAVALGLLFVLILFSSIAGNGYTAFRQAYVRLDISLDQAKLDPDNTRNPEVLGKAAYRTLVRDALFAMFPEVTSRPDKRELANVLSNGAEYVVRQAVMDNPGLVGTRQGFWVPVDDEVDMLIKGYIDRNVPESDRRVSDKLIGWVDQLQRGGHLESRFNTLFFSNGDSRDAELAGVRGALMGSLYTLVVTLLLSFPVGVATAVYLEEMAPRNRITDFIEVNINNLAAVPSIVFGLLGLAVFINFFGMPRSAPVVGGLVLTLMTLPTIIIASRAALKAVPPSIRQAALAVGASPIQTITHHVLPLALPGMLTGTIIGMAQALGETAPLLMIGMIAFIVDVPQGVTDPSTVLPVQIFLWADAPERAFVEKTSGAILVLLGFLTLMNIVAVVLRKRFETRW
jgi:phosphate transport system permease protein